MDVKTRALDRVLEALSPTLATEIDRVVRETREAFEQEFQSRLQAAVRDAEAAAASAATSARLEIDRAVAQAKNDARREVSAELERQFAERLEAATTKLRQEAGEERAKLEGAMVQLKSEWSGELNKLEDERDRWRAFAEAERHFGDASSQSEILTRFMTSAQPYAQGLAVYVSKADGLALWRSKGNGAFPKILSQETTDPESYFKAIAVRGKTVGAICASPAFHADALDFLTGSLERAIEAFGLRLRTPGSKQAV